MRKSSLVGLLLLSSLIVGSTNMLMLQGAVAQNYYNDDRQYGDSYSGYRDDDNNDNNNKKKYVCKDGPFDGLLTSSVEFCKPSITVPTDFPTIQAAINASNPG